mmetsp:Transcript_22102/g.71334  ORF Transcript_22102/g.71334 Transcript_22102/m.71334 type:complete len:272 (-) Transcript_22102:294-1109(-)
MRRRPQTGARHQPQGRPGRSPAHLRCPPGRSSPHERPAPAPPERSAHGPRLRALQSLGVGRPALDRHARAGCATFGLDGRHSIWPDHGRLPGRVGHGGRLHAAHLEGQRAQVPLDRPVLPFARVEAAACAGLSPPPRRRHPLGGPGGLPLRWHRLPLGPLRLPRLGAQRPRDALRHPGRAGRARPRAFGRHAAPPAAQAAGRPRHHAARRGRLGPHGGWALLSRPYQSATTRRQAPCGRRPRRRSRGRTRATGRADANLLLPVGRRGARVL